MKAKPLTNHYKCLTPEERFRLILAASGRGDEVERDRLTRAGKHIMVSRQDHAPYACAFKDVSRLTFLQVIEEVARYFDVLAGVAVAFGECEGDAAQHSAADSAAADAAMLGKDKKGDAEKDGGDKPVAADAVDSPAWHLCFGLVQAAGYVLLAKVDGWKLFCEKMNVPPFMAWQGLPGFGRLQHGLEHAKEIAFDQQEFLRWSNLIRPKGTLALSSVCLTADAVAAATEEAYRQQVRWWGG